MSLSLLCFFCVSLNINGNSKSAFALTYRNERNNELAGCYYVTNCCDGVAVLSYDDVARLCLKRSWPMLDGIGNNLFITVNFFEDEAHVMVLFNVI